MINTDLSLREIQAELQALAEQICRDNGKGEIPAIHLKYNRKGFTYHETGYISIPIWAVSEGREFLTYYLIHEVAHWLMNRGEGHSEAFKVKEIEILSRYGLTIIYRRAYPKILMSAGRAVWEKRK